jgi:hypothetical protein
LFSLWRHLISRSFRRTRQGPESLKDTLKDK